MNKEKWAIITGAAGGMGTEITRALANAGYHIVMACRHLDKAEDVRQRLSEETGNPHLEVMPIDLSSMKSVAAFAEQILQRKIPISLLMNNAGTMETGFHTTSDGFERTVSVNYIGPYLLTRLLIPVLAQGARIVNMVSCTHAIGRLDMPDFFHRGKSGNFWRLPIYCNTKLALLLFTLELSQRLRAQGITVNAADPGIVSSRLLTMHKWLDPLTNIFLRPFIRNSRKGAETAIHLLLSEEEAGVTGQLYANKHPKKLPAEYTNYAWLEQFWDETERSLAHWLWD